MPWVKVDDAFFTDEAVMAAGVDGRLLFLAGLCHASRNLTDGAIDKRSLQAVAGLAGANPEAAELLVELGLWVDEGSSYRAPRYLDFNPPAEKVRAEREAAKQRMKAKRSDEVQPNTSRTSDTPVPSRPLETSSSSSSVTETGVPDDVWTSLARKKLAAQEARGVKVANPSRWQAKVIANDKAELGPRAYELWTTYKISPSHLADVLASGGSSPSLNNLERRTA